MSENLSEEEMRAALFGDTVGSVGEPIQQQAALLEAVKPSRAKRLSSSCVSFCTSPRSSKGRRTSSLMMPIPSAH